MPSMTSSSMFFALQCASALLSEAIECAENLDEDGDGGVVKGHVMLLLWCGSQAFEMGRLRVKKATAVIALAVTPSP